MPMYQAHVKDNFYKTYENLNDPVPNAVSFMKSQKHRYFHTG